MNFSIIRALMCALAMCISLQALAEENCLGGNTSHEDARTIRKLTLSIGQSAASISADPALADIVVPVAFERGIVVYVDQPFDLTYQQEGLSFNVRKTHTLWMTAGDNQLKSIGIELCPLFENDFDAALRTLQKWKSQLDGMKLDKIDHSQNFPISDLESLGTRFQSARSPAFGQSVGLWRRGSTYIYLDLSRIERGYVKTATAAARKVYMYKVSLHLSDAARFDSIYK